eukprot:3172729-Karenia_brevis.AAC.1
MEISDEGAAGNNAQQRHPTRSITERVNDFDRQLDALVAQQGSLSEHVSQEADEGKVIIDGDISDFKAS